MKRKAKASRNRHTVLDQAFDGTGAVYSEYVTYLGNSRWLFESIGDVGTMSDELESDDLIATLREADEFDNESCPLGQRLRGLLDAAKVEGDTKTVEELLKIDWTIIATEDEAGGGEHPFVNLIADIELVIAKAWAANKNIPWKDLNKKTKYFRGALRKSDKRHSTQARDILAGIDGIIVGKYSEVNPECDSESPEIAYWCVSANHARVKAALEACAETLKKWAVSAGL